MSAIGRSDLPPSDIQLLGSGPRYSRFPLGSDGTCASATHSYVANRYGEILSPAFRAAVHEQQAAKKLQCQRVQQIHAASLRLPGPWAFANLTHHRADAAP